MDHPAEHDDAYAKLIRPSAEFRKDWLRGGINFCSAEFRKDVSDKGTVRLLFAFNYGEALLPALAAIRGLGLVVRWSYVTREKDYAAVVEITDLDGNKVLEEPFIQTAIDDAFKEAKAMDDAFKEAQAMDDAFKEAQAMDDAFKEHMMSLVDKRSGAAGSGEIHPILTAIQKIELGIYLTAAPLTAAGKPNTVFDGSPRSNTAGTGTKEILSVFDASPGKPFKRNLPDTPLQGRLLVDSESTLLWPNPSWVGEQTSLNSSRYGEERRGSKMHALAIPTSSMSRDLGTVGPCLWLDSGANNHTVGDSTILTNLRDLPIGRVVMTADGSRLAVVKVGDIQTPDIKIQDVFYVPGLQMNLVSVRQLAKSKVVTTFYENHAELWSEGQQIGGAIVDDSVSLYKMRYLH